MHQVDIRSDSRYPVDRSEIRKVILRVLQREGVSSPVSVSVLVVGDRKMSELNLKYHQVSGSTDVLSFPYLDPESSQDVGPFVIPEEAGTILGDLVISYPRAVVQAREKNCLVDEEISFLVEHGLMHLLGNHHD